jgi:hypothetical protein
MRYFKAYDAGLLLDYLAYAAEARLDQHRRVIDECGHASALRRVEARFRRQDGADGHATGDGNE